MCSGTVLTLMTWEGWEECNFIWSEGRRFTNIRGGIVTFCTSSLL